LCSWTSFAWVLLATRTTRGRAPHSGQIVVKGTKPSKANRHKASNHATLHNHSSANVLNCRRRMLYPLSYRGIYENCNFSQ
ncbi:MAG: hypothetical protein RR806_02405, partial [Oscillospiraceae bacterium]